MRKFLLASLSAFLLSACGGNDSLGDTVTPDGDVINLGSSPKGWVGANTNNGRLVGYNQDYSFYGSWLDDSGQLEALRVQGHKTQNVPQQGSATYYGNVARYSVLAQKIVNAGTSKLHVDFGNKVVHGELSMDLARDITLHPTHLRGNEFAGQASVLFNDGGTYQGAIYGPNAEETAGIVRFSNNGSLDGVFGGKRY